MPTVGWIQETGWNRHTDAFPLLHDWKPEPIQCPLCSKSFTDRAELTTHLGVDHPLKLPMLRIGGNIGFAGFTIREGAALKDLEIFSATECILSTNGSAAKSISPKQLGKELLATGNAQHRLLLRNDRKIDGRQAESEIEIRVAIPDDKTLEQIDGVFLKILAVEHPTMAEVDRFLHDVPPSSVANDYTGALADYVVAILLKEQDRSAGTTASFESFKGRFVSSRRVLIDFNSSLARAIVAAIDFNLNHFTPVAPTSVAQLQAAHRFFAAFSATGGMPLAVSSLDSKQMLVPACPIDKATHVILNALTQFPHLSGYEELNTELPGLGKTPLSEYDLAKIGTLKAGAAVLLGKKAAALHHLRRIEHDYHFGAWANTQLENLTNHE